jgi:hypothetical protein
MPDNPIRSARSIAATVRGALIPDTLIVSAGIVIVGIVAPSRSGGDLAAQPIHLEWRAYHSCFIEVAGCPGRRHVSNARNPPFTLLALTGAGAHNRPMDTNDTKPVPILIFSDFV